VLSTRSKWACSSWVGSASDMTRTHNLGQFAVLGYPNTPLRYTDLAVSHERRRDDA
jgi:hypothetical protein